MLNIKNIQTKQIHKSVTFRLVIIIIFLYVISGILRPAYFEPAHLMQVLVLCSFLGIICIGQTFEILTGGIDLSVAYTITLTACVFAQTAKTTGSGFIALIVTLLVGVVIGLFKGAGVVYLKITPMVMTLATASILMSLTFLYTGGVLKGSSTHLVTSCAKGSIIGFRICVLIWLALGIIAIWILRRTTFGRSIYSVGCNIRVAKLSGINTNRVLIGVYVYATLMMTIVGILLIGYLGYPNYTMGDGYQLISIAAVVIGGTSILGGHGDYLGTIGGVIIIYLVQSILIILNMAEAGKNIVYGMIILSILLAYGRKAKSN